MKKKFNVSFGGEPLIINLHVYVHAVSEPSCPSVPPNSSFTNQDNIAEILPFKYIHVAITSGGVPFGY